MPAAANLADLFIMGPAVELALQPLFAPIAETFIQTQDADLAAVHVDVQFTLGAWTGHWHVTPQGQLVHAAWSYQLRLNVATTRLAVPPEKHGEVCGHLRAKMLEVAGLEELLPFHSLASLNEVGQTESINVGDEQDVSAITYGGLIVIRPGSWPAGV